MKIWYLLWRDCATGCGQAGSAEFCLLYLADPKEASMNNVEELTEWFEDAFEYTDCADLMDGNPLNKVEKCPMMLEATFQKIAELLEWDE